MLDKPDSMDIIANWLGCMFRQLKWSEKVMKTAGLHFFSPDKMSVSK